MRFLKNICLVVLITSCGGSGGSSSGVDNNIAEEIDNNLNSIEETCEKTNQPRLQKCDLNHENLSRYYFIYIPENIDSSISIPVLFALHGYGSSAYRHYSYTNYAPIADNNNFIVIYPQGATSPALSAHWNVGGWTSSSTNKDIDFIDTIIDLVKDKLQIDSNRIYSSGMSNGGYMSYHLACNLSEKIAAVASVTGSMTVDTYNTCNPTHSIPVLQIHGLLDFTVPYDGNAAFGSKSIPDIIDYWVNYNSCDIEANSLIKYSNDFDLIVYDTYENCLNNVNVKLILHPKMDHTWPFISDYNVSASNEVWDFVSKYDLYGLIQ